jgi:hypothetical protein
VLDWSAREGRARVVERRARRRDMFGIEDDEEELEVVLSLEDVEEVPAAAVPAVEEGVEGWGGGAEEESGAIEGSAPAAARADEDAGSMLEAVVGRTDGADALERTNWDSERGLNGDAEERADWRMEKDDWIEVMLVF